MRTPTFPEEETYFVGKMMDCSEGFKISFADCEIEVTVLFSLQQGKHHVSSIRKEKQRRTMSTLVKPHWVCL